MLWKRATASAIIAVLSTAFVALVPGIASAVGQVPQPPVPCSGYAQSATNRATAYYRSCMEGERGSRTVSATAEVYFHSANPSAWSRCLVQVNLRDDTIGTTVSSRLFDCTSVARLNDYHNKYGFLGDIMPGHKVHVYITWSGTYGKTHFPTSEPVNSPEATVCVGEQCQCQPFETSVDKQSVLDGACNAIWWYTFFHSRVPGTEAWLEARSLYDAYLTPGRATATRTHVRYPQSLTAFKQAPETQQAVQTMVKKLVAQLRKAPPPLQDPATTRPHPLQPTGVGANLKINWGDVQTTPGFIAGGTGSVDVPSLGRTFYDTRDITGTYIIKPTVDAKGVLQKVALRLTGLQLKVNDSIDFCPGNLGGWPGEVGGRTLDMSRLERTPHPAGTWAKPILFDVNVPLDATTTDITSIYRKARGEAVSPVANPAPGTKSS